MLRIIDFERRADALASVFSRRAAFDPDIDTSVASIIGQVSSEGDAALLQFTQEFDGVRPEALRVPVEMLARAYDDLDHELRNIIGRAAANIRRFHDRQVRESWFLEDGDGVLLGQRVLPLERVGLYVPGGTAAYPSSVLMNAIPAQVARVAEIALVSPPAADGLPQPTVMATAHLLGLNEVYAVGGAQAVAALALGTESIRAVDKIVGPGNAYVAAAKKQVYGRVDIDSVAGPSEIVILADASADPDFVAADLLSQAEHDERASAILVTTERSLAEAVAEAVARLVPRLNRRAIVEASLRDFGAAIVAASIDDAVRCVNELAPEHLELLVESPWDIMHRIRHAGAIFMGPFSTEPVGDYFAGPNHVLPTGGTARYASALSVDDFLRHQSIISYTGERLAKSGPDIVRFAEAERLDAHAKAVQVRLDRLAADSHSSK